MSASAVTGPARLVADHVTVAFAATVAVDDVSLALHPAEVLGLVGPNGAGKSTLLRTLAGLQRPTSGSVRLQAEAPAAHELAYLPQHVVPDPLFPARVDEVVWMGRYPSLGPWRRPRRADRAAVADAVDTTGIGPLLRRPLAELSGGQLRRVAIARALTQEATFVLMDEPFAGLDTAGVADLTALLRTLAATGVGVLVVNHDLAAVAEVCDRVALLRHRVLAVGPPEEVLQPELVARAYGGPGPRRLQHV